MSLMMMAVSLTLGGVNAKPPIAPGCVATASSLTPAAWVAPHGAERIARGGALRVLSDVPLPGPANRFDYQSFDPTTRRIYINHMNAGQTLVFDVDKAKVIKEIGDVPGATGVLAVPARHQVYVSAAGAHEVVIIDDRTLTISSRVGGIQFPDGIGYDPDNGKVFVSDVSDVSDVSGRVDVVIDAANWNQTHDYRAGRRGREYSLRLGVALHTCRGADSQPAGGNRSGRRAHCGAVRSPRSGRPARLHA